jgi:hypothetical protein
MIDDMFVIKYCKKTFSCHGFCLAKSAADLNYP